LGPVWVRIVWAFARSWQSLHCSLAPVPPATGSPEERHPTGISANNAGDSSPDNDAGERPSRAAGSGTACGGRPCAASGCQPGVARTGARHAGVMIDAGGCFRLTAAARRWSRRREADPVASPAIADGPTPNERHRCWSNAGHLFPAKYLRKTGTTGGRGLGGWQGACACARPPATARSIRDVQSFRPSLRLAQGRGGEITAGGPSGGLPRAACRAPVWCEGGDSATLRCVVR
jgi:hypothetical protein